MAQEDGRHFGYSFPLERALDYIDTIKVQGIKMVARADGDWEVIEAEPGHFLMRKDGQEIDFTMEQEVTGLQIVDEKMGVRCFQFNEKGQMVLTCEISNRIYVHG